MYKLESSENTYIIKQHSSPILESSNIKILVDKKGKFEKLNLGINTAGFILLVDGSIQFISEITPINQSKIEKVLNENID